MASLYERLRACLDPAQIVLLEIGILVVVWLTVGTVVFALNQPNFDAIADRWIYSFFFCVNAGLGVGNVPLEPTRWYTKLIASAFCFVGHTMVIGGAAVYFAVQSDTVMKKVALSPVREEQVRRQRLLYHFSVFLFFVLVGVAIAFTTAQLSGWMMAFEFSVTMLTSAGLVEGVEDDSDWICQALWMLAGIPFSIAFFSELSAYVWHVARHHRHRRHHRHGFSESTTQPLTDRSTASMPATEYIYLERLARAAGYLRERDAVPTENVELEDLQATLQVGELIISLIVWWLAGTLFYYLYQGFSLVYSFYYAINVGLGIGNCPYQPDKTWSRLYTIFHCIAGSSLIYGGVSTVFKEATERLRQRMDDDDVSTDSEDDETEEAQLGRVYIYGVIYIICLLLGIPVAWVCGYTKWYDVIEFTITYMTTAGLLSFDRDNSHGPIYFVSACYIALAIPVAAVFISELASEAFVHREHRVISDRIRESEDSAAGGFQPPPPPPPSGPKKTNVRVPSAYARFLRGVKRRVGFSRSDSEPARRPSADREA